MKIFYEYKIHWKITYKVKRYHSEHVFLIMKFTVDRYKKN